MLPDDSPEGFSLAFRQPMWPNARTTRIRAAMRTHETARPAPLAGCGWSAFVKTPRASRLTFGRFVGKRNHAARMVQVVPRSTPRQMVRLLPVNERGRRNAGLETVLGKKVRRKVSADHASRLRRWTCGRGRDGAGRHESADVNCPVAVDPPLCGIINVQVVEPSQSLVFRDIWLCLTGQQPKVPL